MKGINKRDKQGRIMKGNISWCKGLHVQINTGRTHFKKGRIPLNKKEVKKECKNCGERFLTTECLVRNGKKFCSRKCYNIYSKKFPSPYGFQKGHEYFPNGLKGKTYEEYFGEEDAIRIKGIMSRKKLGHIPWNKNKKSPKMIGNTNGFKKGMKPWNKNKPHSKETIQKLRARRLEQIIPTKDTKIERIMQDGLENKKIDFKKHAVLLNKYQVDLFIKPNLVIECDGDYWHNLPGAQEKDKRRDFKLKEAGYNVLRFWEHEILKDKDNCLELIKNNIL